jgi:hypothetical protein
VVLVSALVVILYWQASCLYWWANEHLELEVPKKYKILHDRCEQQPIGLDCGVYLLYFAERLVNNDLGTTRCKPNLMRALMASKILRHPNCVIYQQVEDHIKKVRNQDEEISWSAVGGMQDVAKVGNEAANEVQHMISGDNNLIATSVMEANRGEERILSNA